MANQAYQWSGINKQGQRISGVIQVVDIKEAQLELKKRNIEITTIKPKMQINISLLRQKIKPKDILLFTRYLSTMLSAGLPILQALEIIGHDQENPTMQKFVTSMRSNISSGKTLAESFGQYPEFFNELYCNLISAGEKSGTLDKILIRLAAYLEKSEAMKRKVKKALIYPAAVVVVATIVTLILLLFVVPHFQEIFSSFGAKLPAFTQLVINLSDFVWGYWWLIIGMVIFLVLGARHMLKTNERVREQADKWIFKMIIIGPILKKSTISRFTRTLSITLDAGMPIVDAMRSMADIMGSKIYKKAVNKICDDVISGHQLSVSMSETHLFPNMVIQMTAVGEASGSLSAMLGKIADYYEDDVNQLVDNLSSLLEPLIMAVLGVVIGSFVIAMYLPIFKMGSLF